MKISSPLSSTSSHQAGVSPGKGVALLRCAGVLWFIPSFLFLCLRACSAHQHSRMTLLTSLLLPLHLSFFLSPPLYLYERLAPLSCLSSFILWFTGNDIRLHRTESERMFWRTFCPVCLVCITVTNREKPPDLVLACRSVHVPSHSAHFMF